MGNGNELGKDDERTGCGPLKICIVYALKKEQEVPLQSQSRKVYKTLAYVAIQAHMKELIARAGVWQ